MPHIDIHLRISGEEYQKRYRAPRATVFAHAADGRSVSLPAAALQRFVTREGVHGAFRIEFGADGRLRGIERL